jgi:hypothetical protein
MPKDGRLSDRNYQRLMDKIHRLAYELDYDASRVRSRDDSLAESLKDVARRFGRIARGES